VLAADVALEILVDSAWQFSRECRRLPLGVIRELLGRKPTDAMHVYLTLAVDPDAPDAAVAERWAHAIQGLADLETIHRWASPQKKAKFRALASDERLLAAIQGAAANGENVSNEMLAVLVADGSAESFDALVPHLDTSHRLDALRMLRVHAKDTPALRALFAELDRDSPAHGLARLVGLPASKVFWFTARISAGGVHVQVSVDSRREEWFAIEHDLPGLGRCEPSELPAWLARAAAKLALEWDVPVVDSNLRSKRDQIARWLVPPVRKRR
jgi:hypothetical protein